MQPLRGCFTFALATYAMCRNLELRAFGAFGSVWRMKERLQSSRSGVLASNVRNSAGRSGTSTTFLNFHISTAATRWDADALLPRPMGHERSARRVRAETRSSGRDPAGVAEA